MSKTIAVAFAGSGTIKELTLTSLLNDWLGFGAEDAEGFYEPSDNEIQLFLPVSQDHWNDQLEQVWTWSAKADLPYNVVLQKGERGEEFEAVVEDASKTIEAANVNKALIDNLSEAAADEKYLVLLWNEDDEDADSLLTLAEVRGIPAKDLTDGLDDLRFAEEDEPEEEEATPEPEPEPAKPARRGRRGKAAEADPEPEEEEEKPAAEEKPLEDEEETLDEEPAPEPAPKRGRAKKAEPKAEEPEPSADTNPNPTGNWGEEKAEAAPEVTMNLTKVVEALQAAEKYFRHIDEGNALKNLSDEVKPSPITLLVAEGLKEALSAHGRLRVPDEGEKAVSEAQDEPETPKRGRGRPRTKEETFGYLLNEKEGVYRKAGRGRPRRGEVKVELTAAEVKDLTAKGLIDDED